MKKEESEQVNHGIVLQSYVYKLLYLIFQKKITEKLYSLLIEFYINLWKLVLYLEYIIF